MTDQPEATQTHICHPLPLAPLMTKRSQKCMSCKAVLKPGAMTARWLGSRTYKAEHYCDGCFDAYTKLKSANVSFFIDDDLPQTAAIWCSP